MKISEYTPERINIGSAIKNHAVVRLSNRRVEVWNHHDIEGYNVRIRRLEGREIIFLRFGMTEEGMLALICAFMEISGITMLERTEEGLHGKRIQHEDLQP